MLTMFQEDENKKIKKKEEGKSASTVFSKSVHL